MNKIVSLFIAVLFVFSLFDDVVCAELDSSLGTEAVSAIIAAETFYESSVLYRMGARNAALNPNSKGIAFEIISSDIKNLFSPGTHTTLSASMTDEVADLVTRNCNGEVVQLIQCKAGDSASYISKTLNQVAGGKYEETELLTTTEFAEKFNVKAEKMGLEQRAVNSHISNNTVEKICSQYLGQFGSQIDIFNTAFEYSGYSAIVTAGITTIESIINGYSLEEAAAHVTTESAISALSIGFGTMTAGEMALLATALGATPVVATVASGTLMLLVPAATGYYLHVIAEKTGFEAKLVNVAEYLKSQAVDFGESYTASFGTFCTNCGADLPSQEGYDYKKGVWACTECGMLLVGTTTYEGEKYPGFIWFCDSCNACLSRQKGFSDYFEKWSCLECGYENQIDDEQIIVETFDNDLINEVVSFGTKAGAFVGEAVNDVSDAIDFAKAGVSDAIDSAKDGVSNAIDSVKDGVSNAVDYTVGFFQGILGK